MRIEFELTGDGAQKLYRELLETLPSMTEEERNKIIQETGGTPACIENIDEQIFKRGLIGIIEDIEKAASGISSKDLLGIRPEAKIIKKSDLRSFMGEN